MTDAADDSRMKTVMDMMSSQHETTRQMIDLRSRHIDEKLDFLSTQFKDEIPSGHGEYHRKLIEVAARRQGRIDAAHQGGIRWAAGFALAILAAWASGAYHTIAKALGWEK